MKKIGIALLIMSLVAACHKSNSAATTGSGFWTVDGQQQYNANFVTRKDTAGLVLLVAQDTLSSATHPSNSIAFLFGSLPADSGSFQVLGQAFDTVQLPGPGQVSIFGTMIKSDTCGSVAYLLGPYGSIYPTWTIGPGATVKVVNGKINVSIPGLYGALRNACYFDSLVVSANIQEH